MPPAAIKDRYETAIDLLVRLHRQQLPATLPVIGGSAYVMPVFDVEAMLIEVSLLLDWYLPDRGVTVTETMRSEFNGIWREPFSWIPTMHLPKMGRVGRSGNSDALKRRSLPMSKPYGWIQLLPLPTMARATRSMISM